MSTHRQKLDSLLAEMNNVKPKMKDACEDDDEFTTSQRKADDNEKARSHYVKVEKSKMKQPTAVMTLDSGKYAGKRVSRKQLYESDESDESDEEEDKEFDDQENDFDESESESDEQASESSDDISNEDSNDVYESTSESEVASDLDATVPKMTSKVRKELQGLASDEKKMMERLTLQAQDDVQKGHHVRQQISMWESCLDVRIRMQPLLNMANRLPDAETHECFVKVTPEIKEKKKPVIREAKRVLAHLIEMQHASLDGSEQVAKRRRVDPCGESTSSTDYLWSELSAAQNRLWPYCDAVLEKWHHRVGGAVVAGMAKQLKVVSQSVPVQVQRLWPDRNRWIERTRQLKANSSSILGQVVNTKETSHLPLADVFDDSDFYQQLLRALIDSRVKDQSTNYKYERIPLTILDDAQAIAMRYAAARQHRTHSRPNADRKGSKGRRIRYEVMPRIANFMAPVAPGGDDEGLPHLQRASTGIFVQEERPVWTRSRMQDLYAHLLGK